MLSNRVRGVSNTAHLISKKVAARMVEQKKVFYPFYEAAKAYKAIHGDVSIPFDFVVPCDERYPKDYWGKQLGNTAKNIVQCRKKAQNFLPFRPLLEDLGFGFPQVARKLHKKVAKRIQVMTWGKDLLLFLWRSSHE